MTAQPQQLQDKPAKATKEDEREAADIVQRLQESGEYTRLQEKLLMEILDKYPEWWDEIRSKTRSLIQKRKTEGVVLNVTMDELAAKLTPAGKAAVPTELKQHFIAQHIQKSITDSSKH